MATYSGNDDFISIDGTDLSGYQVEIEITPSRATTDVTAGSGIDHVKRNEGLADYTMSFTIAYDSADHATIFPLIAPGTHTVIYGPQGSTAGTPKHEQSFIITEAPTGGAVRKDEMRVFTVSAEAAAAPVSDMYAGDTW